MSDASAEGRIGRHVHSGTVSRTRISQVRSTRRCARQHGWDRLTPDARAFQLLHQPYDHLGDRSDRSDTPESDAAPRNRRGSDLYAIGVGPPGGRQRPPILFQHPAQEVDQRTARQHGPIRRRTGGESELSGLHGFGYDRCLGRCRLIDRVGLCASLARRSADAASSGFPSPSDDLTINFAGHVGRPRQLESRHERARHSAYLHGKDRQVASRGCTNRYAPSAAPRPTAKASSFGQRRLGASTWRGRVSPEPRSYSVRASSQRQRLTQPCDCSPRHLFDCTRRTDRDTPGGSTCARHSRYQRVRHSTQRQALQGRRSECRSSSSVPQWMKHPSSVGI